MKKTETTPVLQLVQSIWMKGSTPRQKLIASFGNFSLPRDFYKEVAACLEAHISNLPCPIFSNPEIAQWYDKLLKLYEQKYSAPEKTASLPSLLDGVMLDSVEHSATAMLGPLLPLEKAWKDLELDSFLEKQSFTSSQINAAKICIYNRLLDPVSENGLPRWVDTTAFSDISGYFPAPDPSHYYRCGDKLFAIRDKLEKHLHEKEVSLWNFKNTIWLYDLTNSYFEGLCAGNTKAKRSANSKEKRTDCPVIALGLVLGAEGFPVCHRVFNGNQHDCKSLPDIIKDLEALADKSGGEEKKRESSPPQTTIVLDGGIATETNLKLLVDNHYNYIVNGKRTSRDQFHEDFVDEESFHVVGDRERKKPVLVCVKKDEEETILLCRSESRKLKEDAMVSKTEEHFLKAVEKLKERVKRNDPKLKLDKGVGNIEQLIGKIRGQFTRASKFYTVAYDSEKKTVLCTRNDEEYQKEFDIHGCYHLRTNRTDLTEDEIWHTYITLTRIEASFRSMKSDLGLRPFYHQKDERCEAHVLFTVLAFHLQRFVEYSLEKKGMDVTFTAVKRLLQTHCYSTMSLPTASGSTVLIRKPGRPDDAQKQVYEDLNICIQSLPKRKQIVNEGHK